MNTLTVAEGQFLRLGPLLLLVALSWWLVSERTAPSPPVPATLVERLESGTAATMTSPFLNFQEGWRTGPLGADPREPADPWSQPSGRFSFRYHGQELYFNIASGAYWGFLFVRVDGEPANQLAWMPGNHNADGQEAGYLPLLAPERQSGELPEAHWMLIHQTPAPGEHLVEVEIWRSWGQWPIRGVASDIEIGSGLPVWPAILIGLTAFWLLVPPIRRLLGLFQGRERFHFAGPLTGLTVRLSSMFHSSRSGLAAVSILLIGVGIGTDVWASTLAGLALLAMVSLTRLEIWCGVMLFGLPFYLIPLPILPGQSLNLIEVGVWGGLMLAIARLLLDINDQNSIQRQRTPFIPSFWLFTIVSLALVSTFAASQRDVALREWRTIFVAGAGFALLLHAGYSYNHSRRFVATLIGGWLGGATIISILAIWQYLSGEMIIQAEGLERVRGLYGSPNNLALYLDRTTAMTLALVLFGRAELVTEGSARTTFLGVVFWGAAIVQLTALLLTFSKGALYLAVPAMLVVMAWAGWIRLRGRGESLRPLWGIALVGVGMGIALLPFQEAERFQRLVDFRPETTAGVRLNLWRSSLAMALDHPLTGVGPDNFLYAYRSGYILPPAWRDPNLNHPHNVLLDLWTRLGIGGLILASGWLASGLYWLRRGLTGRGGSVAIGALSGIAASLAHGLIDASYALPDLFLVWVLLLSLGYLLRNPSIQQSSRSRLRESPH